MKVKVLVVYQVAAVQEVEVANPADDLAVLERFNHAQWGTFQLPPDVKVRSYRVEYTDQNNKERFYGGTR